MEFRCFKISDTIVYEFKFLCPKRTTGVAKRRMQPNLFYVVCIPLRQSICSLILFLTSLQKNYTTMASLMVQILYFKALTDREKPREAYINGLGDLEWQSKTATCTMHEARILIYNDQVCRNMLNSQQEDGSQLKNAFCAGYLQGGIDGCQVCKVSSNANIIIRKKYFPLGR